MVPSKCLVFILFMYLLCNYLVYIYKKKIYKITLCPRKNFPNQMRHKSLKKQVYLWRTCHNIHLLRTCQNTNDNSIQSKDSKFAAAFCWLGNDLSYCEWLKKTHWWFLHLCLAPLGSSKLTVPVSSQNWSNVCTKNWWSHSEQ